MDEGELAEVYSAPRAGPSGPGGGRSADAFSDPGPLLARWERRRLGYNATLAVVVLGLSALLRGLPLLDARFWQFLLAGAFGANVCFCTGPVAEAYLSWVGLRGPMVGRLLFSAGLMLSVLLTLGAVVAYFFRLLDPA